MNAVIGATEVQADVARKYGEVKVRFWIDGVKYSFRVSDETLETIKSVPAAVVPVLEAK